MNKLQELLQEYERVGRDADFAWDHAREEAIDEWGEVIAMRRYRTLQKECNDLARQIREIDPEFSFLKMRI